MSNNKTHRLNLGNLAKKDKWPRVRLVTYEGGGNAWLVDARIQGRGERLFFKTKVEAETMADQLRIKRQNAGKVGVQIPDRLRVEALECAERLESIGATLRQATDYYLKHVKPVSGTRTCEEAAAELIKTKRKAGKRESYVKALAWAYGVFNRTFGSRKTNEVMQKQVEQWLDSQDYKLVTRRDYIRDLGILFNYCVERGYSAENPVAGIEKPLLEDEEPEIFTVDEAAALLAAAAAIPEANPVAILAIGLFAGLRTSELKLLDWSEVDLEQRLIEVTGRKAKTRQRRLVKISDNLAAWLTPLAKVSGPVMGAKFRYRRAEAFNVAREAMRNEGFQNALVKWPKNGMRHSFASYHLAHYEDASRTALELGHADTTMLFAHYRNLVRPREAARYWQIMPKEISPEAEQGSDKPDAETPS